MVTPPEADAMTAQQRLVYDRFPANLTQYLLLTEASAAPYLDLGFSFRHASLPAKDRETVILRVGGLRECAYEAMQHVEIAKSVGIDEETIDKLLGKSTAFGDPKTDRLTAYVDAAVSNASVPEAAAALGEHYDDGQIAEIALLVGHYVMTAIFLQSLDVPLDAEPTPWGDLPQ